MSKRFTEDEMFELSELIWAEGWVLLSSAEIDGEVTHLKLIDPPDAPDGRAVARMATVVGTTPEAIMESLRRESLL